MERLRGLFITVTKHRIFVPALVAALALIIGVLFAFEHSRNLLKVRGPYLIVLATIMVFPVFAFRFFDPHEDSRPIAVYFLAVAVYYTVLGSPDFVGFFRLLIFERMPPGTIKQILFGIAAFAALAGFVHFVFNLWAPVEPDKGFLRISAVKFLVYALLHVIYLNLFVAIAREKFGILTGLS